MTTVFRDRITTARVKALIKAAENSQAGLFLFDTDNKFFGVRASPLGKRGQKVSWLVQEWRKGKLQRAVIGDYFKMPLEKARSEALSRVADPDTPLDTKNREKRQRERTEAAEAVLGPTVEKYLTKKEQPNRYWRELRQSLERDLVGPLGADKRLTDIRRRDLREVIEAKPQAMGRYLYAIVRPFFAWCITQELIEVSPLDGVEQPKPVKKRDRKLSDAEIQVLWQATGEEDRSSPQIKDAMFNAFFRLLLLTAQRREEVGGIRWSELNLTNNTWTIPKERAKNGKEHLVHLSPQALAVIATIARVEDCPFLFSGNGTTSIKGYSKAKERLDAKMAQIAGEADAPFKIPAWRTHDLRRTAASGMAKLKIPPHITERVLNHISGEQGGLRGVYQVYEYEEDRKAALEVWGNYVEALVSNTTESNVIPFTKTA